MTKKHEPGMAYDMKKLNKVFAFLSFLLLVTVGWMFLEDYMRPWKGWQIKAQGIKKEKIRKEILEAEKKIDKKKLAKLEKDYTTQIDNAFKEFQTKAQSYSSDAANQTDVTNQARQKELESMQTNLQEFRDSAAQELQKKPFIFT